MLNGNVPQHPEVAQVLGKNLKNKVLEPSLFNKNFLEEVAKVCSSTGGSSGGFFNSNNGSSQSNSGGGFFSNNNTSSNSGGFFSQNRNSGSGSGGGFFSNNNTSSNNTSSGGGFFSNSNKQGSSGGGFFSNNSTQNSNSGGGFFNNNNSNNNTGGGGFFSNNKSNSGSGFFSNNNSNNNNNSGGSNFFNTNNSNNNNNNNNGSNHQSLWNLLKLPSWFGSAEHYLSEQAQTQPPALQEEKEGYLGTTARQTMEEVFGFLPQTHQEVLGLAALPSEKRAGRIRELKLQRDALLTAQEHDRRERAHAERMYRDEQQGVRHHKGYLGRNNFTLPNPFEADRRRHKKPNSDGFFFAQPDRASGPLGFTVKTDGLKDIFGSSGNTLSTAVDSNRNPNSENNSFFKQSLNTSYTKDPRDQFAHQSPSRFFETPRLSQQLNLQSSIIFLNKTLQAQTSFAIDRKVGLFIQTVLTDFIEANPREELALGHLLDNTKLIADNRVITNWNMSMRDLIAAQVEQRETGTGMSMGQRGAPENHGVRLTLDINVRLSTPSPFSSPPPCISPLSPPVSSRPPSLSNPSSDTTPSPPLSTLLSLPMTSLACLPSFSLCSPLGQISFLSPVDIRGHVLDEDIVIEKDNIQVYPLDTEYEGVFPQGRPKIGQGINVPARLTLWTDTKYSARQWEELFKERYIGVEGVEVTPGGVTWLVQGF